MIPIGRKPIAREQIIEELRRHEAKQKSAGIVRLSLFGSLARGDGNGESDVDLMAEFDEAMTYTIPGKVHLENRLADLLGVRVDLAHAAMLRDGVRENSSREAVLVF